MTVRSDRLLPRIGWGAYDKFEGPWFAGTVPFVLPTAPTFLDKVLAVITATEGGHFDAVNMYDRCKLTVGLIQWGEACAQRSVSNMLALARAADPDVLDAYLAEAELSIVPGALGHALAYRGDTNMDRALLGGSTGIKGQWTAPMKVTARRVAAVMATLWEVPAFQRAQLEFTEPRLLTFATGFGRAPTALFAKDYPETGWEGAMRAAYLSFAANLPGVAAKRADEGLRSDLPAKDRCINLLRRLTFEPGIAIYPGRYEKIRPVLERLFDVDLPDFANELRTWRSDAGDEPVARFPDAASIQRELIALGYDLGPAGADGKMGRKSTDAVRAFQRDYRLGIDGLVGRETLGALVRAQDARLKG